MARRERLRDAAVQEPASRNTQLRVGCLSDLIVTEVVGAAPLLPNDAPLPELIQAAHQRLVRQVGRRAEDIEVELAADGRSQLGQLAAGRRKLRQPALDDLPDFGRP